MAQPGSAPALGAGSRRFKSSRPDHPTAIADFGIRIEELRPVPGCAHSAMRRRACSSARIEQRPPEPCVGRSNRPRRTTTECGKQIAACGMAGRHSARRLPNSALRYGERSSIGRALDCGSRGCGFETLRSPHPDIVDWGFWIVDRAGWGRVAGERARNRKSTILNRKSARRERP